MDLWHHVICCKYDLYLNGWDSGDAPSVSHFCRTHQVLGGCGDIILMWRCVTWEHYPRLYNLSQYRGATSWNFDFHCPLPREMDELLDLLGLIEFVSLGVVLI